MTANMRIYVFILIIFCMITGRNIYAQNSAVDLPYAVPQDIVEMHPRFHFAPVNQDTTNACWSFSTLSFIESELQRINGQSVKLSVMYPVYFGFIEKAKKFVETRGESCFKPGDLFTTVVEVIQIYGMIPEEAYHGQVIERPTRNHKKMENEIEELKKQILDVALWDESMVVAEVKAILDKYLGEPPSTFSFRGETLSPVTFAEKYVNLPWNEYLFITSFGYASFNSFTVLEVPDNWRKIDRYFNVPLDNFYSSMKTALTNGFSLAIDGDINEPGRIGLQDVCIIPDYDIPGSYINQAARDYRFDKGVTKDDHLMHIVGFGEIDGEDWFLVKDSWRDAFEGRHKGYFFYHGDYAKLKILAYMVHKDGVPAIAELMSNNSSPEEEE
jgi:bleomycin hydrolase